MLKRAENSIKIFTTTKHLGYPYQTNSRPEEEHLKLAMGGVCGVEHGNHDHVDKVVQHPH